jgi:BlaI family penicillinase repressor
VPRIAVPRRATPHPTEAELEILVILWRHGPRTVGEVRDSLDATRATGYTTALKLLQTMLEKGLVSRDEAERAHRYAAAVTESEVQARVVDTVVERAFGGSRARLILHAIGDGPLRKADLAAIRKLLDEEQQQ